MLTLPKDVYDVLNFSCEMYGGIGAGYAQTFKGIPFCIFGQAVEIHSVICDVIRNAGMTTNKNDVVVRTINIRNGRRSLNERVSWQEYCEEAKIIRSDSDSGIL